MSRGVCESLFGKLLWHSTSSESKCPTQCVAGSNSLSLVVAQLTLPVFWPSVPGGAFAITVPGPGFQPPDPIVLVCCAFVVGGGVAASTQHTPFPSPQLGRKRDLALKQHAQPGSPCVRRLTV